jgi:hypothetical protein
MFEDLPIQNPNICHVVVADGVGDEVVALLSCARVARTIHVGIVTATAAINQTWGGCLSSDLGGVYVGKGGVSVVPPFTNRASTKLSRAHILAFHVCSAFRKIPGAQAFFPFRF